MHLDARPDFSAQSTDFRMEVSVAAGLSHISSFLDQPVVIVDGSGNEDTFLLKSAREHAEYSWKTLIELPSNGDQTLRWLTRLSASALKGTCSCSELKRMR